MRKFLGGIFCFCFLLLVGCGCSMTNEKAHMTVAVTDSFGQEIHLFVPPKRVVVLTSTLAEMYHAVGGEMTGVAYLPGRVYPDYITHTEYVGVPYALDVEKLVAMKPDIVLGMNALHSRFVPVLKQNGIPFLLFDIARYEDMKKSLQIMATVADKKEKGEQLIAEMDRHMEETEKKYKRPGMTYAAIHGTGQGLFLEVKGSIVCDVADRLGLSDVFGELSMKDIGDKPPFSIEELAMRNPDVIFLTTMVHHGQEEDIFKKNLMTQPVWQTMKAVKNGRVYLLPQKLFLSGPGIDYPKALEYMAEKITEK